MPGSSRKKKVEAGHGMPCPNPHCSGETFIYDTRRAKGKRMRRRSHECLRCGARGSTLEQYEGEVTPVEKVSVDISVRRGKILVKRKRTVSAGCVPEQQKAS
ncbi:hypothetical protein HY624_02575 [Candidatus Uhrbacteria bacterium]|nr:hypothetical protein [Candidatus Uhrbacteria bacterium]